MKTKRIVTLLLTLIIAVASLSLVACGGDGLSDKGFKEGYATNYVVEETIVMADLVDNLGADYELVAEKEGTDVVENLTGKTQWTLKKVGTWTFKLKILGGENKGEYALTIKVKGQSIRMDFNAKGINLKANKEYTFEEILDEFDIETNFEGYGTYTKRIFSIQQVDKEIVKFDESVNTYTFTAKDNYKIIFGIVAEDGQLIKNIVEFKTR